LTRHFACGPGDFDRYHGLVADLPSAEGWRWRPGPERSQREDQSVIPPRELMSGDGTKPTT
jgi:hypothetical protein